MKLELRELPDKLRKASRKELPFRYQQVGHNNITSKTEAMDLVTAADEAAECFLKRELPAMMWQAFSGLRATNRTA